jgi:lipoteichoic acid synthase
MSLSKSIWRIGSKPFILFSIIMLFKGFLAWLVLFDVGQLWTLLLKELPFVWITFCLIEWFATKRKLTFYLIANLLFTAIFFAVIMYYKYYGVIVTYHALQQVNQVTAVKNSVFSLMDPYFLFIFVDIIIIGIFLFRKNKAITWKKVCASKLPKRIVLSMFIASVSLTVFNIMPNRASMSEITKAEQMGILNYEAYTIFAKDKQEIVDADEITQTAINELKGIQPPANPLYYGAAKGKNVIMIQMESFQEFLIDLKIDGQEITPVLNQLAKGNFYFPNMYQQVGQGNTSDAEFVVNTSYYIPPRGAATQTYANKELPSLPKLLKDQGYVSTTFHTNVVEFWNRREMYDALGFDRYYDQKFFGEEDTVFFGPSDEVLYKKTAAELQKMNQDENPFYAHVISMTAHHPYTIPEEKLRMTLPERYEKTMVGDYIRSQNYADYTLGLFIEELKASGVWEDSIIVLYGDHLGLPIYSLDRDDKELMNEIYGHEYGYADMINIPMIIAAPEVTSPQVFEQVGGQVDILPTLMNLMGISLDDYIHFGQDLLNQTNNLLPQRYYLPTGSFMSSTSLFITGSGFQDGTEYPLDPVENYSAEQMGVTEEDFNRTLKLLNLSDSYVMQLPDRIVEKK